MKLVILRFNRAMVPKVGNKCDLKAISERTSICYYVSVFSDLIWPDVSQCVCHKQLNYNLSDANFPSYFNVSFL